MCQSEAIATSTELTHERTNDKLIKKGWHMGNGKNDNPFTLYLFLLHGKDQVWYNSKVHVYVVWYSFEETIFFQIKFVVVDSFC